MIQGHKAGFYEKYIKRPQDVILAVAALIMLSPLIGILAVLVGCKMGTPVIFRQARPGLGGKVFYIYKFRTMTEEKDSCGKLLPDCARLTKFGKFLRSTSLDELPEIFNIIKGDMSIVGPRPLLVAYLPLYNERQKRRHEVRPGITGYAQVNGRNAISWEKKFELDVAYVDHIRFVSDWKIIARTISAVLRREGISSDTSVAMEEFHGSKE